MPLPVALQSLPNQLTLARIAAVPLIVFLIVTAWEPFRWLALLLYIAAALTDWLDGFLARRMNVSSDLGKMLDPIADKLLVGALLITFAYTRDLGALDLIPAIAILMREIFIAGLREYLGNRAVSVPVSLLAKWKTTIQLVALGAILAAPMLLGLTGIAIALLWVAGALTLWTGWEYLKGAWPSLAGNGT
jgi:CDP-diacylglycerol--glycerol-3-phosphate 3-phosphatidyltransferase